MTDTTKLPVLRNWVAYEGRLYGRLCGGNHHPDGIEFGTTNIIWMNPEETEALTELGHYRLENPA